MRQINPSVHCSVAAIVN